MALLKKLFFIFSGIVFFSINLHAADYFWVGGSGNWSDVNHWATSSGGSIFHTQVPTANDDVYFDDNSGLVDGSTVTLTANSVCGNMTWTNTGHVTFNRAARTLAISGSLITNASVTFSGTSAITFNGAGNHFIKGPLTLTSGTTNLTFTFSGEGGYTLKDLVINSGRPITFNLNGTGGYTLENLDLTSTAGGTFIFTGTGGYAVKSPVKSSTTLTFTTGSGGSYILPDILEIHTGGNLNFSGNFTNENAFRKLEKTGTGTVTFNSTGNLTLSDELELNSTGNIAFNGNYTTAQPLRRIKNTNATTIAFGTNGNYTLSDILEFDCSGAVTLNGVFVTSAPLRKITKPAGTLSLNATGTGYTLSDELELDCPGTVTLGGNFTSLPIKKITKSAGNFTFNATGTGYILSDELELDCPGLITLGGNFTSAAPLRKLTKPAGNFSFSAAETGYTLSDELELACIGSVTFSGNYNIPAPLKKITNTENGTVTFGSAGNYTLSENVELSCAGTLTFNGPYNMMHTFRSLTNDKTGGIVFNINVSGSGGFILRDLNFDITGSGSILFNFSHSGDNNDNVTIDGLIKKPTGSGGIYFGGGTAANRVPITVKATIDGPSTTFRGQNDYTITSSFTNNRGALSFTEQCSVVTEGALTNKTSVTFGTSGNCEVNGTSTTPGTLTFNGAGTYAFRDSVKITGTLTFTNGILDLSNQYLSVPTFNSTGGNITRQLNITGSTIEVNNWTYTGGAELTPENSENSVIRVAANFTGKNGDTYGTVEAGTGTLAYGNFKKIRVNKAAGTLNKAAGDIINTDMLVYTVYGGYAIAGGSTVNISGGLIKEDPELSTLRSTGTEVTINMAEDAVVEMDKMGLKNIKITGQTPYTTTGSWDMGGNSGWLFQDAIPVDMNTYFWRGGVRDGVFNNINNWELGYPGSGILPSIIFGATNDICFPPDVNNPATMTVVSSGNIAFRNMHYNATQSITVNLKRYGHNAQKIYVNKGILNLKSEGRQRTENGTLFIEIAVEDSVIIKEGAELTLYDLVGSFGSTLIDGKLRHFRSYDHTIYWKDITVNGTFSSTNNAYIHRSIITNGVTVNPGGLFSVRVNSYSNYNNTDLWTFGNSNTGGDLKLIGTAKAEIISENRNKTLVYFNGSVIDPNGELTMDKVHIYFQSPVPHTLDLGSSDMPRITNSDLYFHSPLGYSMDMPFRIPTNNVYIHTNCGGFHTNGHDISCNIFGITGNNATANTLLNLNGSRLYVQQYIDRSANYNQQSDETAIVFTSPAQHYFNIEGTKTFQSVSFTSSAPSAVINMRINNTALTVDTFMIDTQKIDLDNLNTNGNNSVANATIKVNHVTNILRNFDISPTNILRPNGYQNRTITLSVNEIWEHSDICRSKSKFYNSGNNRFIFDTQSPVTTNDLTFAGIQFTGAGLTTSEGNNLGGNSGTAVQWTTSSAGQTFYWIGGTGNWSDPDNWTLVPGETSSTGCVPSAVDDVVFDCNSFTGAGQTVTIDGLSAAVRNITWDAALAGCNKKGRLEGNSLIVTGSADFSGCEAADVEITFSASGDERITTGEIVFTRGISFSHSGTYTLQDNLYSTSDILHNSGGLVAANDSVSCRIFQSLSTSNDPSLARWYDFTNTKLTVRHTTANFDNALLLNLDNFDLARSTFAGSHIYTLNGSKFRIAGANNSNNLRTLQLYNLTASGDFLHERPYFTIIFNDVSLVPNNITAKIINNFTCRNLMLKSGRSYTFRSYNITNQPTKFIINGQLTTDASSCSPETTIKGAVANTEINFSNQSSTIFKVNVTNIKAGTNPLIVSAGTDGGGNTNVSFDDVEMPSVNFYWVGGAGNWSDPAHWSLGVSGGDPSVTNPESCIPTSNDHVIFDIHSFNDFNQRVTLDLSQNTCKNMIWTADAGAMTPSLYAATHNSQQLHIYGSLDLVQGLKMQGGHSYGIPVYMLGKSQEENSQYIRFNGFNNAGANDCRFRFFLSGGGRYDWLDNTPSRIQQGGNTPFITVAANSSFYAVGRTILSSAYLQINGGSTKPCTVDISGSTFDANANYYQLNKFSITIDANRTFIADGSTISTYSGGTVNNQSGRDVAFHNVHFPESAATLTTTSNTSAGIIFNKISFDRNSNIAGASDIVTDTLQFSTSSANVIAGGKKITVNKKLIASGTPCATIAIESTNTTPAVLSSENCDMIVNFGKLSYISADITNGCTSADYKLVGKATDQTGIENWTLTNIESEGTNLLGADTTIACQTLPYIQTSEGFGPVETYTWSYKKNAGDAYIPYGGNTDTIHITKPGYYKLHGSYGQTCDLSNEAGRRITVIDTIAPSITCNVSGSATVSAHNGVYQISGAQFDAVATDPEDCAGVNPGIETWYTLSGGTIKGKTVAASLHGEILNPGLTTVKWFASDHPMPKSNVDSCSFDVVVLPENPVLSASLIETCSLGNTTSVTITVTNAVSGFTYTVYDHLTEGKKMAEATAQNDGSLDILFATAAGGTYYVEAEYQGYISENRTAFEVELKGPPAFEVETIDDEICSGEEGSTIVNLKVPNSNADYLYAVFGSAANTDTLAQRSGNGSDLDFAIELYTTGIQTLYVSATDLQTGCSNIGGRVARQYLIHPLPKPFTVTASEDEYCMSGTYAEIELIISDAEIGATYRVTRSGSNTVIISETAASETFTIRFNETNKGVNNYSLYAETVNGCQTPATQRVSASVLVNAMPDNGAAWVTFTSQGTNKTFEICGPPQEFTVEFSPVLGFCTFPEEELVFELAPGIEYVPGSIVNALGAKIVAEHDLSDPNKPVFKVPAISGGEKVMFTYQAKATIDAYELFYLAANAPLRKFVYRYGSLDENSLTIQGFQGHWGDIRIVELSESSRTANRGETFTLDVKLKNVGGAPVDSLMVDFSAYNPDLTVTATDKGTFADNRITLKGSVFPNGSSLAQNEEVEITVTLQVGSCAGTVDNTIKALWGCGSSRQSDAQAFSVLVNSGTPLLETILGENISPRDDWEGISYDTIYIVNKGDGVASDVLVELRQIRFQLTTSFVNFSEFALNSLKVQKGKNGTPQLLTPARIDYHSTVGNRKYFRDGGISGVDLELPFDINPGDTIIVSFNERFIDLERLNNDPGTFTNAYRRGWGYDVKYKIPCTDNTVHSLKLRYDKDTNPYIIAGTVIDIGNEHFLTGRTGGTGTYTKRGAEIASYSESNKIFRAEPSVLSETAYQGELTFEQASFIMDAFIDAQGSAYVEVIITHPVGIALSNPSLKARSAGYYQELIGFEQINPTTYVARFRWKESWSGKGIFKAGFTFDCDEYRSEYPRGDALYDGFNFKFQTKSFKSSGTNGLPSVIHESERVNVTCSDPNAVGVIAEQFIAERWNVSPYKEDLSTPSEPDRKKFWYGDTIVTRYTGSIKTDATDQQWEYVTVIQDVPVPAAGQTLVEVTARVKRSADDRVEILTLMKDGAVLEPGTITQTSISGGTGGRQHKILLSPGNFGGTNFLQGDSVIIETKIRYTRTSGIENMQIPAEFYASHVAAPADNLYKYSGPNVLATPLTAYYIRFLRTGTAETFTGCNEITVNRGFSVIMNSSQVGSTWNFFTNEFREIGQVRRIYMTKPQGYELKNNQVTVGIVSMNSPKQYNLPTRVMPVSVEGNEWVADLGAWYDNNTIKPEDEAFDIELRYTLIPTCNTPVGEVLNAISIDLKGSMSQYPGTSKITISPGSTPDNFRYYPPVLNHTGGGNATEVNSGNGKVSWPVYINNTSTVTDAGKLWMTAPVPTSDATIRIDSITYGTTKYLPDGNGFFDLGSLPLASSKEFKVCGTLLSCTTDPQIDLYYYWACGDLPSDIDDAACKNTIRLTALPPKGELISSFTDIGEAVTHCQPISYSLSLTNSLSAPIKNIRVVLNQMPGGLSYVDGSLEYSTGTPDHYLPAPAEAITVDGNKVIFDVSGLTSPQLSLAESVIFLRYELITSQGFISGTTYQVEIEGNQWCDEPIRSDIIVPVRIYLDGLADPPYLMSLGITPLTISTCAADEFILKTSIRHASGIATDEQPGLINEIILDLPAGIEFVEAPSGSADNSSLSNPQITSLPGGQQRIRWKMPDFARGQSRNFEFKVVQATSLECANANRIELTTAIVNYIDCDGETNEIFIITGEMSSEIIPDKPKIEVFEILRSETMPDCSTNGSLTFVRIRLKNNGKAIPSGTPIVVEIFSRMENDGTFDDANLLGHYTATTGMAAGSQVLLDVRIAYPSSMTPDLDNPLYAVIRTKAATTSPAQCVCDMSYKSFTSTETNFPTITLSVNGLTVCEGEETTATATQANGYSYEWSIDPNQGGLITSNGHQVNILWNGITFPSGITQTTRTLNLTVTEPDTGCYREFSEPVTINYKTRSGEIYRLPNQN